MKAFCLSLFFLFLVGCAVPRSAAYREFYAHLDQPILKADINPVSDQFVILYVEARHLDYTDNLSFFKTVAKHPSDGSKNRDVGHAWIYLQGKIDGQLCCLEGGHSGELGSTQARYFDGIMNYIDFGCANPTDKEIAAPLYEPNPIKYLWETQHDGFFQVGSGGHRPTFSVKLYLTPEQFQTILQFVYAYDYRHYSLVGNQCSSFVAQVASLANLELESRVTIPIAPTIIFNGEKIRFWQDPYYSKLTISSPDVLEKSLMQSVRKSRAVHGDSH